MVERMEFIKILLVNTDAWFFSDRIKYWFISISSNRNTKSLGGMRYIAAQKYVLYVLVICINNPTIIRVIKSLRPYRSCRSRFSRWGYKSARALKQPKCIAGGFVVSCKHSNFLLKIGKTWLILKKTLHLLWFYQKSSANLL